jgi:hypothetical protein
VEENFDKDGTDGLLKKHPVAYNHPNKIKEEVIEGGLCLRKEYQLGSWRIKWYFKRCHDICISESSVSRILKRYGVERLQKKAARRALHSKRHNKSVPGHHVQVDLKVLLLKDLAENEYERFQYTAVQNPFWCVDFLLLYSVSNWLIGIIIRHSRRAGCHSDDQIHLGFYYHIIAWLA